MDMDGRAHESVWIVETKKSRIPCLAHLNSNYLISMTTDARTKVLGAVFWQEQPNGVFKTNQIRKSLFLTEEKCAVNELELLAVEWGLKH